MTRKHLKKVCFLSRALYPDTDAYHSAFSPECSDLVDSGAGHRNVMRMFTNIPQACAQILQTLDEFKRILFQAALRHDQTPFSWWWVESIELV